MPLPHLQNLPERTGQLHKKAMRKAATFQRPTSGLTASRTIMPLSIFDIPPELFQRITLLATLGSPIGPPKELYNCLLTCRTFWERLSPTNASELYYVIFSQKFDVRGPRFRLGQAAVRENAPLEMRRRFSAIQIFKKRALNDPGLTEALWIAYLMVEDSDTSQKNVKQLLGAGVPAFLDMFLRFYLLDGGANVDEWPVLNEAISLAIALSWTLASQRVLSDEDPCLRRQMMVLLKPIVFASFRYSIFHTPEEVFHFNESCDSSASGVNTRDSRFPPSILLPQQINYFGSVRRMAHPPSGALFAILLYFTRMESLASLVIPPHIICKTRQEALEKEISGPCVDDINHFQNQCRTRFAGFPGIDVGIKSCAKATLPDTVLCQPSLYKAGTLSGEWQGSVLMPCITSFRSWTQNQGFPEGDLIDTRFPLYVKLEEHVCYDRRACVPMGKKEHGAQKAWLPEDLVARETDEGMEFSDSQGSFRTTYETLRRGAAISRGQMEVVDVIITGKTDEQYLAAWGGYTKVLGRVRVQDGLMALMQSDPRDMAVPGTRVLRGYVTSSQNLVGRLAVYGSVGEVDSSFEGSFSLSRNHIGGSRGPTETPL